ncbi:hypothetical protein AARAC_008488 [Aspergillus arachidicola]|uniref:Uncharacterized protein n=1 Tax=Aspergillus arachidicola TaxID=656916 RepID=A0A2G7FTS2_9EURO|nr:hypothetical protein AARAC_008488 [Aspergillus arachidicola]
MSQQPSDTLVDKKSQKEKNNLPQQQTIFYPCVNTTNIQDLQHFIKLGDELRREREMKVVKRYIQQSSDDKKRLKLLLRFAIASKLRPSSGFPGSADVDTLVMSRDLSYEPHVDT